MVWCISIISPLPFLEVIHCCQQPIEILVFCISVTMSLTKRSCVMPYLPTMALCFYQVIHFMFGDFRTTITTPNRILSVWLYLMLLSSYYAQHCFSIPWQLVLECMLEDVLEFSFYHSYFLFHTHTDTDVKHVTSTYYHNWHSILYVHRWFNTC